MLYRVAGIRASGTRAYRLAHASNVTQLESTARFPDLQAIRKTVEENCEPGATGNKSVLLVHQEHLPPDLSGELSGLEDFHRCCEMLGFAANVYALQSGFGPPTNLNDSRATFFRCEGFPVRMPTAHVDLTNSLSFGIEELENFLGGFFGHAGKIIFLALRNGEGNYCSSQEFKAFIQRLIWHLRPVVESHVAH